MDWIERAERDPEYAILIDNYNAACQVQDESLIEDATQELLEYGAWVDNDGYWRHPDES